MNDSMLRKKESVTPPGKEPVKKKYCAKCQNHQRMEVVKGHKRHCTFKTCRCVKCRGTDEKRKITARNVQARREELLEREKLAAARSMNALDQSHGVRSLEDLTTKGDESRDGRDLLTTPVDFQDANKDHSPASHEEGEDKPQPKVAWDSILLLCENIKGLEKHHLLHLILKEIAPTVEEARYRILQAMREVAQETSKNKMLEDPLMQGLGHHYQWTPTYYPSLPETRVKELQESALYSLPIYHRPEHFSSFGLGTLPFFSAIPFHGISHTVPSTSYTLPTHEPPRPTLVPYEDFQKFENKGTSPFSLHPEEPQPAFSQVEI